MVYLIVPEYAPMFTNGTLSRLDFAAAASDDEPE
jgi:hypothetical protein